MRSAARSLYSSERELWANGGGEFVGVRSEHFAEIAGGTGGELRTGVLFAKAKRSVMSQLAAVSACGSAITAARRSGSE